MRKAISASITHHVACDFCGSQTKDFDSGPKAIEAAAHAGWGSVHSPINDVRLDCCPSCRSVLTLICKGPKISHACEMQPYGMHAK
jgi:hypothetical protein